MAECVVTSQFKIPVAGQMLDVDVISNTADARSYIQYRTKSAMEQDNDPFTVVDLGKILTLYEEWKTALPRVYSFYAVKANADPVIIKLMASLGMGFDCASMNEIKKVLRFGVSPDKIIFANPYKMVSHLKFTAENGVYLSTFDSKSELHKVKQYFPSARLVIRLRANDTTAGATFGNKFGCTLLEAKELIWEAKSLELNLVGVCFHIGSGAQSPSAFKFALESSAELFKYGASLGYEFTLLDLGGGLPGANLELFKKMAGVITETLEQLFRRKKYPKLQIIAEPGRFFPTTSTSVATNIIGVKQLGKTEQDYFINDGAYGSFIAANLKGFDSFIPKTVKLLSHDSDLMMSSFFGPSLSPRDTITAKPLLFPKLSLGDWVYFENVGAYSRSFTTNFNGFELPVCYYYIKQQLSSTLFQLLES